MYKSYRFSEKAKWISHKRYITIYAVLPTYDKNNKVYYQVLPYDLKGTIKCHFEFYRGLFSLIPFLMKCRLTEHKANKLQEKVEKQQ